MLKPVFQLIGLIVVLLILLLAVLFYLDGKDLLSGELDDFIGSLRALFEQIKSVVTSFVNESGIANDAADLLDEGADKLRGTTPDPNVTPEPDATPEVVEPVQIIIPSPAS